MNQMAETKVGFGMAGLTMERRQRACLLCFQASRLIDGSVSLVEGLFVLVDEKGTGWNVLEVVGFVVLQLDSISKLSNNIARRKNDIISRSSLVWLPSSRVQKQKPNETRRRRNGGGLLLLWVGCHFYFCF